MVMAPAWLLSSYMSSLKPYLFPSGIPLPVTLRGNRGRSHASAQLQALPQPHAAERPRQKSRVEAVPGSDRVHRRHWINLDIDALTVALAHRPTISPLEHHGGGPQSENLIQYVILGNTGKEDCRVFMAEQHDGRRRQHGEKRLPA